MIKIKHKNNFVRVRGTRPKVLIQIIKVSMMWTVICSLAEVIPDHALLVPAVEKLHLDSI